MNEQEVTDLMIHVERIVRPVRAGQGRKLRMRLELLEHLKAAVEEEREKGVDGPLAMERAKDRMGGPADLTRGLQRAVPLVERVLLTKLPVPRMLERWESRQLEKPGAQNLNHWRGAVVVAAGLILTWLVLAVGVRSQEPISRERVIAWLQTADDHRARFLTMFSVVWATAGFFLPMLTLHFLEKTACQTTEMKRLAAVGALILASEVLCVWLILSQVMGRVPSPLEILYTVFPGTTVLAVLYLMARWMSGRREPYVKWTSLHIAG